jgi:hypothetical protein
MNKVLNFELFGKLHESKEISKKDIGVIGPNLNGEIKLRLKNPGLVLKRVEEGDDYIFSIGEKSCCIPKKYVDISTQPGYEIVTFDTNMNWFKHEQNTNDFNDIIEEFISSEFTKMDNALNSLEEDANIILDILGIEEDIKSFNHISELSLDAEVSNGMEIEIIKERKTDLFKKFFVYKNSNAVHPFLSIKRKGNRFICEYQTPKGKHKNKHDSIAEILKNPIDRYLLCVCTGGDLDVPQRELVDHLIKLFKYHSWEISDSKNSKYIEEKEEIKRIMEILKNSIPEEHIEEMYSDARSKFFKKP